MGNLYDNRLITARADCPSRPQSHADRSHRGTISALPQIPACRKTTSYPAALQSSSLAAVALHESASGPTLRTWAVQQVVSYLGYTGRAANVIVGAAIGGLGTPQSSTLPPRDGVC